MTPSTPTFDFRHYLAAKKSVDDRALNAQVWQQMAATVQSQPPLRVLEVGAGIGTMIERLWERQVLRQGWVTAVDADPDNIHTAHTRLRPLAADLSLELIPADVYEFMAQVNGRTWDLLIAHAFLDLLDVPTALPRLLALLRPGGWFYFTINFDGATIWQPTIDPTFDALVETLYHRTMDERQVNGRPSGDSHTGRHLFAHLRQAGGQILAAGSSDWVVFAGPKGYPADEAAFLRHIIATMHTALQGHPDLDTTQFDHWIATRYHQITQGDLVYVAHQLDFWGEYVGVVPAP